MFLFSLTKPHECYTVEAEAASGGGKAAAGGMLKFYTDDAPGLKARPPIIL